MRMYTAHVVFLRYHCTGEPTRWVGYRVLISRIVGHQLAGVGDSCPTSAMHRGFAEPQRAPE
jgi:hypothetical protein